MADNDTDSVLSPLDGRYLHFTRPLRSSMSDHAYYLNRIKVENEYLISILDALHIPYDTERLTSLLEQIEQDPQTIINIKALEKVTNHDVKAIIDYITDVLKRSGLSVHIYNKVHYALTSQDVNSLGFMIGYRKGLRTILDNVEKFQDIFSTLIKESNITIITKTHGQPAVPSNLGKELYVYYDRIEKILLELNLKVIPHMTAKFGGAVGNMNAHYFVHPEYNWLHFADRFVETFGFYRSAFTTQIDNYDSVIRSLDILKQLLTDLLSLEQNIWLYISDGYFVQKHISSETGSSTMPHKVNPIQFENAEGNIHLAIGMISQITTTLPISRYQRDIKDSTMLRSIGSILGYTLIAISQIGDGITRLVPDIKRIERDLEENSVVIMEGIQTYLKWLGFDDPYTMTKTLSRGKNLTKDNIDNFIDSLNIELEDKQKLKDLSVHNYIGNYPDFLLD